MFLCNCHEPLNWFDLDEGSMWAEHCRIRTCAYSDTRWSYSIALMITAFLKGGYTGKL